MKLRGYRAASSSVLRVILCITLTFNPSYATYSLLNVTTTNRVVNYQLPNDNVYLVNDETPQNISFAFPSPSIPEKNMYIMVRNKLQHVDKIRRDHTFIRMAKYQYRPTKSYNWLFRYKRWITNHTRRCEKTKWIFNKNYVSKRQDKNFW